MIKNIEPTLKNHFNNHLDHCEDAFGESFPKDKRKSFVDNKISKTKEILANGLDVGGIMEHIIPVCLVDHNKYGLCFKNDDTLYRFDKYIL